MTDPARHHFLVSRIQGFTVAVEAHHIERVASPQEAIEEHLILDLAPLFAPLRPAHDVLRTLLVCTPSLVLRVGPEVELVSFNGAQRQVPALVFPHLAAMGVQQLLLNAGELVYVFAPGSLATSGPVDGIPKLSPLSALR
ncbi:MAG: hypothetical protein ACO3JL_03905 [Myxococcota bacterium]